jgi:hypothetical protein
VTPTAVKPLMLLFSLTMTSLKHLRRRLLTDEKLLAATILSITHLVTLIIRIPDGSTFLDHVVPQLSCITFCVCYTAGGALTARRYYGNFHLKYVSSGSRAYRRGTFNVAAVEGMTQRSRAHKTSLRELSSVVPTSRGNTEC